MNEVLIVYWTGTGNTGEMARLIRKGIEDTGKSVNVLEVHLADVSDIDNHSVIVLGCPAMGAEVLEETEMEPFISEIEDKIGGKKVALFGSYGWGSGEWMEDWYNRMAEAGAQMMFNEGFIVSEAPKGESEETCMTYGKEIAMMV